MSEAPSAGNKRSLQEEESDTEPLRKKRDKNIIPETPGTEEEFYDSSWLYMECCYCRTHMPEVLRCGLHGEKLVLHMHAQYSVFSKSSRGDSSSKEDVRIFKDEFLQKVCSLRNEKGGVLVIHVTDKSVDKGPSLDDFDQKVGEDLSRMVEDDTMYVDNYDRRWYSKDNLLHKKTVYLDFIIVNVKGSSSVSTKDFNTLVTWDGSKERPKAREISRLLWRTKLQPCFDERRSSYYEFKEGERIDLYESRDVQLKRLYDKDLEKDLLDHPWLADKSLGYRITFRLREKLHLLEYVTSFAKLQAGGSFYCGIEEEKLKTLSVAEKTKSSKKSKKKKKKGGKRAGDDKGDNDLDMTENISDGLTLSEKGKSEMIVKNLDPSKIESHLLNIERKEDSIEKLNHLKKVQDSVTSEMQIPPLLDTTDLEMLDRVSGEEWVNRHQSPQTVSPVHPDEVHGQTGDGYSVHGVDMSGSGDSKTNTGPHSDTKDYKTAHNMVKGYKLSEKDQEELKKEILTSLQKDMMWLRIDGTCLTPAEIENEVDIVFHLTSAEDDTYVIEVCVKKVFPGVVFYKSYGPDAFCLAGLGNKCPRVVRMSPSDWIRLLRRAMQCDNCDKPIWKFQPEDSYFPQSSKH